MQGPTLQDVAKAAGVHTAPCNGTSSHLLAPPLTGPPAIAALLMLPRAAMVPASLGVVRPRAASCGSSAEAAGAGIEAAGLGAEAGSGVEDCGSVGRCEDGVERQFADFGEVVE